MWEFFPSGGPLPPSPLFGNDMFLKKNGLFCILEPFIGGSPMLKTVKNGSGIRVDPPPLFFQNSHIFQFFLGGRRPLHHQSPASCVVAFSVLIIFRILSHRLCHTLKRYFCKLTHCCPKINNIYFPS